jgi:paraquat-inducible protein A
MRSSCAQRRSELADGVSIPGSFPAAKSLMDDCVLIACPDCDLLQSVAPHTGASKVFCARCGVGLALGGYGNPTRDAALAVTSLILLVVANAFPILRLDVNGREQQATVFDGVLAMFDQQRYELALLILAVAICLPVAHALSVLVRSYLMTHDAHRVAAGNWALWSVRIAPWGMTEVYLLGALVAFVKLDDLAPVVVGPALYAFALMSVVTAWTASHAAGMWSHIRRGAGREGNERLQ